MNHPRSRIILGLMLLLLTAGVYSATLTTQPTGDDIRKMMMVENAIGKSGMFFPVSTYTEIGSDPHPMFRYYLQIPLSASIHRILGQLNLTRWTFESVEVLHFVSATLGILAFYYAMTQIISPLMSFFMSLCLAFSFGWWKYAVHPDFTILSPVFQCFLLLPFVRIFRVRSSREFRLLSLLLGLFSAMMALFYISSIVVAVVVFAAIILASESVYERGGTRIGSGLPYAFSFLIALAAITFAVWQSHYSGQSIIDSFLSTARVQSDGPESYFNVSITDLPKAAFGIAKTIVEYPILGDATPGDYFEESGTIGRFSLLAWNGILAVVFLAPLVYVLFLGKRMGEHRKPAFMLVVWIIIQLPFGILWVPSEIKWWVSSLVAWYAVIAYVVASMDKAHWARRITPIIFSIYLVAIFVINLSTEFWSKSRPTPSDFRLMSAKLSEISGTDDLFITTKNDSLDYYLPYFENRRVVSYPLGLFARGGDEVRLLEDLENLVTHIRDQQGNVYLYDCSDRAIFEKITLRIASLGNSRQINLPSAWVYGGELCLLSNKR